MRVAWSPEAVQDRRHIWEYIAVDDIEAAIAMDEVFSKAADSLSDFPLRGRPGRVEGTRELILHEHYCLVYEVDQGAVWVLALVHTSRQWPPVRD